MFRQTIFRSLISGIKLSISIGHLKLYQNNGQSIFSIVLNIFITIIRCPYIFIPKQKNCSLKWEKKNFILIVPLCIADTLK